MTDLPPAHHYIGHQHISFVSAPGAMPCYTATQMREYRNQALEEAAKVCDVEATVEGIAQRCAAAIRALKEQK